MVFKFVRAKRLKWQEISNLFLADLTIELINYDNYRANSQSFHEMENLYFLWNQFL